MEEYQFSPLSCATSIRVLVLHTSKGQGTSTTWFSLEEIDTQADPKYEALSYTWGETTFYNGFSYKWNTGPANTFPIEINGSGFLRITKNLNEFLQHLADSAQDGDSIRRVWADQICINQKDIQERNSQVPMMKDIYLSAWRTLIWIGKQDTDMLAVLDLLHAMITPQYDYRQVLNRSLRQDLQQRVEKVLFLKPGTNRHSDLDYARSLANILNKPWFSRAWVIQEAALSREPIVILGSEAFDLRALDHLMVVVACLEAKPAVSRDMHSSKLLHSRGAHTLRHIQTCRRQIEDSSGRRLCFLDILRRLAFSMDASDARDHVYAFLAFQDSHDSQILPDYSFETSEVYAVVSASIARSMRSLSILGLVRGSKYPRRLPSWAIDWRLNKSTQGRPLDKDGGTNFDACRGYPYNAAEEPSSPLECLPVRGKIVGQVAIVSSVAHDSHLPIKQNWRLDEVVESLMSVARSKGHITSPETHDSLSKRVLVALTAQEMNIFKSDLDRENTLDSMLRAYQNFERVNNRDVTLEQYPDLVEAVKKLASRVNISVHRRLFYSGSGLIGLGPGLIQGSDFICILHGSEVPCILRRQRGGFGVVGQCFYENWMHGDLVDWEENEGDIFNLL